MDGKSFKCKCDPGFGGRLCELKMGECPINICHNGGTGLAREDMNLKCECPKWFYGVFCEIVNVKRAG